MHFRYRGCVRIRTLYLDALFQKSEIIYFGVAANGWIGTMLVNC